MTHESALPYVAYLKLSTSSDQTASEELKHLLSTVEETVIGREATCQIPVHSNRYPTVSRHHAKIQPFLDGSQLRWRICDLNAANGTYLNGDRLQGCQNLQSGDRILLSKDGPEFVFECETVSLPVPSETPQAATSELSPVTASIATSNPSPDLSQSVQTPTAPGTAPVQPVSASNSEVQKASSRSLWELVSENNVITLAGHEDLVRSVALSPDGKLLASGSADKTIKIWDLNLRKETQTLAGHKLAVTAVALSPDGQLLASGGADKTIKIWNLVSEESTLQLTGHGMGVNAVLFSPDSKLLASGSADKTIKIWDLMSGEAIQTLPGHKMGVNAIAISPDNQQLASGSADRTVKLWKVASGEEIATLPAFRSSINALFFSPDGEILAISTDDKMIRLWSLKTEQEIRVITGYSWQIGGLAISLNGLMFASGSEDKTVKVWNL